VAAPLPRGAPDRAARRGLSLVLLRGDARRDLADWAERCGVAEIHAQRRGEPGAAARDEQATEALGTRGIRLHLHDGMLLSDPTALRTGQGRPYQVFTPFSKAFLDRIAIPAPSAAPDRVAAAAAPAENAGLALEALELLPQPDWAGGLREAWQPGPAGAEATLRRFLDESVGDYDEERNRPDRPSTSRLSPHLHWGEISPRRVWHAARAGGPVADPFLRQLIWREFAHNLLHHFPQTVEQPLRESFEHFPWDGDPALLGAWQKGETGYPLVDAGMRELWTSGWMHNRVRMVVASFLVKHLLLHWREGADWFADTLVDADLANNTFGWQWTAGCGADAAPYFRIFNPMMQGKRFDPEGDYVRRWLPQLRNLPARWIHAPWTAPPLELAAAGVALGRDYPHPVVEHAAARERALESYRRMQAG
jgi:deoxyribodipyrimidine photo-lyase